MMKHIPFGPAGILLPGGGFEKWACIACDQFTSQPEYWEKAAELAGGEPSCLHIVLPEVYLDAAGNDARIADINRKMNEYLEKGIFNEYKDAMILVERSMADGRLRRGIVGAFALEAYSYEPGSKPLIRPTEGTVLSRIPPRVEIRRDAPLELPHIMVLMDDRKREIIENIDTAGLQKLYDFELMLGGGRIRGYLLGEKEQKHVMDGLAALYTASGDVDDRLLFAVGDGNHSLAAAKATAELTKTEAARYALAELMNIHDEAIDFEPIYRVIFNADVKELEAALKEAFPEAKGRKVEYMSLEAEGSVFVNGLEADVLQAFLDDYAKCRPGTELDYIHGVEATRELAMQKNAMGFVFGGIGKEELFDYVRVNGVLPRKTFSIGHAEEKRYYLEARKIR